MLSIKCISVIKKKCEGGIETKIIQSILYTIGERCNPLYVQLQMKRLLEKMGTSITTRCVGRMIGGGVCLGWREWSDTRIAGMRRNPGASHRGIPSSCGI